MKIKLKVLGVIGLMLSLLSSSATAAGILVHITGQSGSGFAYDHLGTNDGNKLTTSSIVQWIYNNAPPDPAGGASLLHTGTADPVFSGVIGDGTGGLKGTFDKSTDATSASYIRVWENSAPAAGKYYRTIGSFAVGNPMPTENYVPSFQTNCKAAKPPKPKSTAGGFSLAYDAVKTMYLPSFSISAVDQSDPGEPGVIFETVGYNIAIKKKGDATWKATSATKSMSITETDPNNPYYLADGSTEYEVRSQAWNYFGGNTDADWGDPYYFKIPASGGAAGGGSVLYTLTKTQGQTGVFNIGIPFDKDITFVSAANVESKISTVKDLVDKIGVVAAVGLWDPTQNFNGITYAADGTPVFTTTDFKPETTSLKAGIGISIAIKDSVTFTLKK